MCSAPKPPKVQATPAPPPPASVAGGIQQSAPKSPEKYDGNPYLNNRVGRNSLRITRNPSLNVPK